MDWGEIAKFGIGTLSLCGGVAWVSKALFTNLFNKDLADHKAKLDADVETHKSKLNSEIEVLKAQLKQSSDEYQARMSAELARINSEKSFKFTKLHEERLEVLKVMFKHISCIDVNLASSLALLQRVDEISMEEKFNNIVDNYNALVVIYPQNMLFFSPELCSLIENLLSELRKTIREMQIYPLDIEHVSYKVNRDLLRKRHEVLEGIRGRYNDEIKVLLKALSTEFRMLLDVN